MYKLHQVFVQRVFEESQTYDGEMDFKAFLDFVLAMENRNTRAGMQVRWAHNEACVYTPLCMLAFNVYTPNRYVCMCAYTCTHMYV